jgi:hypothetical protein
MHWPINTREAVASDAVDFQFLPGHLNPADILSKHWGYPQVWASALRPILFWKGDTSDLLINEVQPTQHKPNKVMAEVQSGQPTASNETPDESTTQTKGSDKIFDQVDDTTGVKARIPEGRDQTETMMT